MKPCYIETLKDLLLLDITPVNDDVLCVSFKCLVEACKASTNTNVLIAAYTTAQVLLVLYEYLSQLGLRVLYYDTESCTYVRRNERGVYNLPPGRLLGKITDELGGWGGGEGSYIKTFISRSSLYYAYQVI